MSIIFTRGLAFGDGFCNRLVEMQQLRTNIKNGTHTLIVSPRRYGKTSLALQVLEKEGLPYTHIDLFMKYTQQDIENEIYEGISQLLTKIIKPTEKAIQLLQTFLKQIKISLSFGDAGFEFSLTPIMEKKPSLKFLLEGIDQLLAKKNKHAIIFIDELQTISESNFGPEVESSLRFIAQKTKNIIFIFSGSNRHMLREIFDNRARPFYKLCSKMPIQKISAAHYIPHLNKFAKKQWGKNLPDPVLLIITNLTDCHPYYINVLCEKVFEDTLFPTEKSVLDAWKQVCLEEQGSISRDLELLSTKQKQLLSEIAKDPALKEPTSKNFVNRVNLTPKGVLDALEILYKHDLIEKKEDDSISIIDPVLSYWARGLIR
jgi:hypothetical protein